jgi:hypothetical protein
VNGKRAAILGATIAFQDIQVPGGTSGIDPPYRVPGLGGGGDALSG